MEIVKKIKRIKEEIKLLDNGELSLLIWSEYIDIIRNAD
jgi:hypothetical protein